MSPSDADRFTDMDGNAIDDSPEPLPCPFCGSRGDQLVVERWSEEDDPDASYHVECLKCGSNGPQGGTQLENDCVRVQYHDVAVGQTVPMHSHPHYIVYPLKAYKVRVKLEDGSETISEHKAGDVHWNEATVHSIENIGDSDVHNLVIELKPGCSCH